MSCKDCPPSTAPGCRTIQVIAPDPTLTTGPAPGTDPSIDESGSTPITAAAMFVTFNTPKITENYRFEYLYVDAQGIFVTPGIVSPVVVYQTQYGFGVEFAGGAPTTGYVLHWRVVVIDLASTIFIDAPESIRVRLPVNVNVFTVHFTNLRSNDIYGFSELRVENLDDPPESQRIILVQVTGKTTTGFTVGINPRPNNNNYFLVARTP